MDTDGSDPGVQHAEQQGGALQRDHRRPDRHRVAATAPAPARSASPAGLLVTGTGQSRRLWIADAANNRVIVLNSTGALEAAFGSAGAGRNQFNLPQGVAVDPTDGDIAVADFGNNRISLWEPAGCPAGRHRQPDRGLHRPGERRVAPRRHGRRRRHQLRRHLGLRGRRPGAAVLGRPVAAGQRHLGRHARPGCRPTLAAPGGTSSTLDASRSRRRRPARTR